MLPLRIRVAWFLTVLFAPAGMVAGVYLLTRDDIGQGLAVLAVSVLLTAIAVALVV